MAAETIGLEARPARIRRKVLQERRPTPRFPVARIAALILNVSLWIAAILLVRACLR